MDVLAKGAACVSCRKWKEKCDGSKPICARCRQYRRDCAYTVGITKRPSLMKSLEARALELEAMIHKLTVVSAHDLSLVTAKLLARIRGLRELVSLRQTFATTHLATSLRGHCNPSSRTPVDSQLSSYEWEELGELPSPSSLHLIDIFLQHREQFYFFIDAPNFLRRVSLRPSHADSIHPCLLNACYLGACSGSGCEFGFLEPYFLRRTRHFLEQSLMYADRIPHFLWANLILGCYLARKRRLEECFSVISAATHLARACGLSIPSEMDEYDPAQYLLSPPEDEAMAMDRIQLAHSFYLMNQLLPVLGGPPPSFPYDYRWAMTPKEACLRYHYGKESIITEEKLSELWRSEGHLKVLLARTSERVMGFAQQSYEKDCDGFDDEYSVLGAQINSQNSTIPPLYDSYKLRPQQARGTFNPNMLVPHMAMHGNGLLLHAMRASKVPEARRQMLMRVDALLGICETVREYRPLHRVQSGVVIAVHVMNAIRVIACELQQSRTRRNPRLLTSHCYAIDLFLDVIEDVTSLSPALADAPLL
ncbi:hypothetical protein DL93DRAFT_2090045, partial [Clavulina sp. PMI_390]